MHGTPIRVMNVCLSLFLLKFSRFPHKDKSENTFINMYVKRLTMQMYENNFKELIEFITELKNHILVSRSEGHFVHVHEAWTISLPVDGLFSIFAVAMEVKGR